MIRFVFCAVVKMQHSFHEIVDAYHTNSDRIRVHQEFQFIREGMIWNKAASYLYVTWVFIQVKDQMDRIIDLRRQSQIIAPRPNGNFRWCDIINFNYDNLFNKASPSYKL